MKIAILLGDICGQAGRLMWTIELKSGGQSGEAIYLGFYYRSMGGAMLIISGYSL
jgi:hypothetical protein